MELTRGTCIFCTSNKIVSPSSAEEITALLRRIFKKEISSEEFGELQPSLKFCPVCLQDIVAVAELKENMKNDLSWITNKCLLCCSEKHIVDVSGWSNFETLLANLTSKRMPSKCSCCLHCIKSLELFQKLQERLFKKFPYLALDESKSRLKNSNEAFRPKKQSSSKISTNNMGHKNALKHLVPLKYSKFNISHIKEDAKMLNQIAFVNLTSLSEKKYKESKKIHTKSKSSDSSSNTSATKHPYYRIKLKINPRKTKVHSGRVSKTKSHDKYVSSKEKKLIVKILKENLYQLQQSFENGLVNFPTPTKASKKMMPEDLNTSEKAKRKNVTFATVLNTEDSSVKHNVNGTPLKSLLKKSVVEKDSFDSSDSEGPTDNFLEEIKKHNDDIFDSLKKPSRTKSCKIPSSSDSEDDSTQKAAVKEIDKIIIVNEDTSEIEAELVEKDPLAVDGQASDNTESSEEKDESNKTIPRKESESDMSDNDRTSNVTTTTDEALTLEEFRNQRVLETDDEQNEEVECSSEDLSRAKKRRQSTIARETGDNVEEIAKEDGEPETKKDKVSEVEIDALIRKYSVGEAEENKQNGVEDSQIASDSDKVENGQTKDGENCVDQTEVCGDEEVNKSTCELN